MRKFRADFMLYACRWGFRGSSAGKECLQCQRPQFDSWDGKIHWRRDRLPTSIFLGFSCGSVGKESAWNTGDLGLIPGLGRSSGEGNSYRTPVFWPGKFHGLYSSLSHKELHSAKWLSLIYPYRWVQLNGEMGHQALHLRLLQSEIRGWVKRRS